MVLVRFKPGIDIKVSSAAGLLLQTLTVGVFPALTFHQAKDPFLKQPRATKIR